MSNTRNVFGTNSRGPGHPYEIVTSRNSVEPGMPDVHPGPDARASEFFKGKDLPAWGGTTGMESDFIHCLKCGYIFNRITRSPGSGYGNIIAKPIILADLTVDQNAQDPVVGTGCVFCGSSNYEHGLEDGPDDHEGTGMESESMPGGY